MEALTKEDNNEEEKPDAVKKDFEKDLKFLEEWLEKPKLTAKQDEKNKNCIDLNILMNGFESAGIDIWEQQTEVEDFEFVDDIIDKEETEKS
jgi:hypothetical protein